MDQLVIPRIGYKVVLENPPVRTTKPHKNQPDQLSPHHRILDSLRWRLTLNCLTRFNSPQPFRSLSMFDRMPCSA